MIMGLYLQIPTVLWTGGRNNFCQPWMFVYGVNSKRLAEMATYSWAISTSTYFLWGWDYWNVDRCKSTSTDKIPKWMAQSIGTKCFPSSTNLLILFKIKKDSAQQWQRPVTVKSDGDHYRCTSFISNAFIRSYSLDVNWQQTDYQLLKDYAVRYYSWLVQAYQNIEHSWHSRSRHRNNAFIRNTEWEENITVQKDIYNRTRL